MNIKTGFSKGRYTELASHPARLGSSILDNIIIGVILIVFSIFALKLGIIERSIVLDIGYGKGAECIKLNRGYLFDGVLVGLLGLLYFAPEFYGWSFGKRIYGLRVAAVTGEEAKSDKLFLRYLMKLSPNIAITMFCFDPQISTLILAFICNAILTISWGMVFLPGRQALYDRWSETAVFNVKSFKLPIEERSMSTGGFAPQPKQAEAVTKLIFK